MNDLKKETIDIWYKTQENSEKGSLIMTSDIEKRLISIGEKMKKETEDALLAMNKSLTDCEKSLIMLVKASKEKMNDDYWHPTFGPDAELPNQKYEWVLVKIRDDPKIFKGTNCQMYNIPHIAKLGWDGKWLPLEWDGVYGSKDVPFEVMYWRPVPGDTCSVLYSGNETVGRLRTYE